MVYKSKKINKRSYLNNKTRIRKKMVGGDYPQAISPQEVKPSFDQDIGDQVNNIYQTLKNKASNTYQTLKNKATNVVKVIANTSLGNELGEEIAEAVKKVGEPFIQEATPILNDFAEKQIPVMGDMANNAIKVVPVVGQVVAAAEEGLDVLQSLENTAEVATKMAGVGIEQMDALTEAQKSIGETLEHISEAASKGVENISGEAVSKGVENISGNVEKNMNNLSYRQQGGGLLKKYQKEKIMIGGRISNAQSEFLLPNINSSQILQQYGGKWKTKRRHYLKRKLTSRSYK